MTRYKPLFDSIVQMMEEMMLNLKFAILRLKKIMSKARRYSEQSSCDVGGKICQGLAKVGDFIS